MVPLAMLCSAWQLSPLGTGSAYSGKCCVPYGELKHSGSDTSFAPAATASRTLEAALSRFWDLLAPTANCTRASLNVPDI